MATAPEAGANAYDRVPYRGACAPQADCRRLEAVARLAGLAATPPATSRVLELGCGTGANLAPFALEHPHASVIGCDLSERALTSAQRVIERLGLSNVTLHHVDLCGLDDGWGQFDCIVCHDVFSWVEPRVRQRILDILRRQLAGGGGDPAELVLDAYAAGTIELALSPPRVTSRVSERPAVSPLVRLQADEGAAVTNQKCELQLADLALHVVRLLDGVHGRDDVSASVAREIQSGRTAVDVTLNPGHHPADAVRLTDAILRDLCDRALLVA